MRGWALLAAMTIAAVLVATSADAALRISYDAGGQIGPYLDNWNSVRASGEQVIIDGPCLSACTLLLGVVPPDRICVTRRARLGFHAAWHPDANGRPVMSAAGTQVLWDTYPSRVRQWIKRRGGLSPHMIYLRGAELRALYPACE